MNALDYHETRLSKSVKQILGAVTVSSSAPETNLLGMWNQDRHPFGG
jgi:hypothetical protein